MTSAQIRTALTHAGTAVGGMVAAVAFMSQHAIDLYAIWDQLNAVVAGITKLIALVTPFVTGAYAVYKASTASKLADIVADPAAPAVARAMPVTPAAVAVADALKTNAH